MPRPDWPLPPDWTFTAIESHFAAPIDLTREIGAALAAPEQSKPLRALARAASRVVVVFTDTTRACPDHVIVPALLRELEAAGVPDDHLTLLCAVGMHRPSTRAEKIAKLGPVVVERYRVIDHDPAQCLDGVNALLSDADLIIATGVVEPHQYAGYSGGGKTVVIGCGDTAVIEYTHGPQFLDHPGVRLGRVVGNPFQDFVRERARALGLKFVVNVVLNGDGLPVAVKAGDPIAVHEALIGVARGLYEVRVPQQYDVIVAKVDPPKDVNVYQASRAVTYLGLSAAPPIKPGGVIIIEAHCPEGAGQGLGEQNFYRALSQAHDLDQLLSDLRADGCRPGEQRAFMLARVLLRHTVIVASSACPDVIAQCRMMAVSSMGEGIDRARELIGPRADLLYVPHPLQTLPIASGAVC